MDAFVALADANRRKIIAMLAEHGELTASAIGKSFAISAPAVSQHLKILREANLVVMKKDAQRRLYSIGEPGMVELEEFITDVRRLWALRLDRLDKYLQTLQEEAK